MANNVDDILIMGKQEIKADPAYAATETGLREEIKQERPKSEVAKEIDPEREAKYDSNDKNPSLKDEIEAKNIQESEINEKKSTEVDQSDDDTDEYGNHIPKARTYTEEEVQRMIRDRLSRGRQSQEQPSQQQQITKQVDQNAEFDENSEGNWKTQLKQFVEQTYSEIENRKAVQSRHEREQRAQAEFESKFLTGMSKYSDFQDVMQDKNITDAMVLSTRSMRDPAAFLYAAAKMHAQELERIAKIPDAFSQATEMGRLEEKMKKARNATRAARPIQPDKGDYNDKVVQFQQSIESRIEQHAKTKVR